jgi:DUF2075 family protein/predicted GIY-YIG superfamily endonuclease
MTDFKFDRFPFDATALARWRMADPARDDWPVVYTIRNSNEIYIGETVNAATRLTQHLATSSKQHLKEVQIINSQRFNKSACLDLESQLIKYFAADGNYKVLNANAGITESNYFDREKYRESFEDVFGVLVKEGLLSRPIPEIVNSNLFKYSPFKALNEEQAAALNGIMDKLIEDIQGETPGSLVIEGDPGTGKTIVAIYLMKLLADIPRSNPIELGDKESMFMDYFTYPIQQLFKNLKIAIVIPQQALRKTISDVFAMTPGLKKNMVKTQFDIGDSNELFDLVIVDEAHRLGRRANQPSAAQNLKFKRINEKLFGADSLEKTQLDWIKARSKHQLLLLDKAQAIKPADLPESETSRLVESAIASGSHFRLRSQMRVEGGGDYLQFVSDLLSNKPVVQVEFSNYDFRFCESFTELVELVRQKEKIFGLSRLLAGFAWKWKSKKDKKAIDIEIDGHKFQWNQTITDWVNSATSIDEIGSIHVIQGYDLNYAGVVIGRDLLYDPETQSLVFNRANYHDAKGKEDNAKLGLEFTDEDLLAYIINIYRVLLTRGIKGTYVYVIDENLRRFLANKVQSAAE